MTGRLHTCYSPVRRSPAGGAEAPPPAAPRLACVKPVASVHPEPGSNSSLLYLVFLFFFYKKAKTFFKIIALAMPSTFTEQSGHQGRPLGLNAIYCVFRIERSRCCVSAALLLYYSLSIVIVSMCSLSLFRASGCVFRESDCKVKSSFSIYQIFV